MTAEEMWTAYLKQAPNAASVYDAWAFGAHADELARLVIDGKKTATASAYDLYEADGEELPKVDEYSVILDSRRNAVCIIQTVKVSVKPFGSVDAEHAFKEGEGDRSLEYWREIHERLFSEWLKAAGMIFNYDSKVVLEEFRVVFAENGMQPQVATCS